MNPIFRRRGMPALTSLITLAAFTLAGCGDGSSPTGPRTVMSVAVSPPTHSLVEGGTVALQATPKDASGAPVAGRSIVWSSNSTSVATVTQQGVVSAIAEGTATIVATVDGKHGEAAITVTAATTPQDVVGVDLDVSEASLDEGETQQLVATPRDAQGEPVEGLGMQWTSSDESVARVGALGLVTAIRPGTATITVAVHGKEAAATITVTAQYAFDLLFAGPGNDAAWEIFRLDIRQAAAAPVRVSPAGAWAGTPRPSPDGSLLAFTGTIDGVAGIYIANADGSGVRLLVAANGDMLGEATWSPDASRIAYTRAALGWSGQIWVVNVDGSGAVSLTAEMEGTGQAMPAWSPVLGDGTSRIAFAHDVNGAPTIWTMLPDGSDKRQLTDGAADIQPAWSPDGETIAFQRTSAAIFGDIWLVDADGENERGLMRAALAGPQWAPVWSPDGRLIAFSSEHETYGQGGEDEIYTVWTDGSKLARRTSGGGRAPAWAGR